ncbi:hypothetical protein FB446DRAFT_625523, partial [Lentinula raphanica]
IQRRQALLHTSFKVKKFNFDYIASTFASASPESVRTVCEHLSQGDRVGCSTTEERQLMNLMKELNVINTHVPGSSASKVAMRNEIRAINIEKGLPSFFLTINPADVYNPVV